MGERGRGFTTRAQAKLWSVYSRCYDGLLDLVPYQRLVAQVVDALDARPGDTVVDLGCGTGNTINALVSAVPDLQVIGVDSSVDMLGVAAPKLAAADVELVRSDLLDWLRSAPSDSVDRVVSVNVLYTMHAADREVFWREAVRILRPQGRLVVVTTDREGVGPVIREHFAERSFVASFSFRLVAVLVMNMVIWAMEARRVFDPASEATLRQECADAGAAVLSVTRCYGGEQDGVDVLLVAEPVVDLAALERPASAPSPAEQDDLHDPLQAADAVEDVARPVDVAAED
jgi:ubiquinone/menaquinone biosynthesis C-methylase UbiE